MIAALTFSPGQVLVFAVLGLGLTLVIVWGVFEAEHDRVDRARRQAFMREVRRQK